MVKQEQLTPTIISAMKQGISGNGAFAAERRRLCSSDAQAFESSVTVVYATTKGDLVVAAAPSSSTTTTTTSSNNDDLMTDLAAHFIEAYNERVEEFSDPFFRRITQATVDPQSAVVSPTASTIRFRIDLQGLCEDCVSKYGGPLFGTRNKKNSKTGKGGPAGEDDHLADAFQDNPCWNKRN